MAWKAEGSVTWKAEGSVTWKAGVCHGVEGRRECDVDHRITSPVIKMLHSTDTRQANHNSTTARTDHKAVC